MAEIIDLEEYRSRIAEQEIDELKEKLASMVQDLTPIFPEPYFPSLDDEDYLLTTPLAGSFGMQGACPCCGYGSMSWDTEYTKGDDKDEP